MIQNSLQVGLHLKKEEYTFTLSKQLITVNCRTEDFFLLLLTFTCYL